MFHRRFQQFFALPAETKLKYHVPGSGGARGYTPFKVETAKDSKYADLKMMVPQQGMMFWTDNMCIPLYAQNPKDAMTLMDYYYNPDVQAVVEYYNDYVCPVPAAQQALLNPPAGWAARRPRMSSA